MYKQDFFQSAHSLEKLGLLEEVCCEEDTKTRGWCI